MTIIIFYIGGLLVGSFLNVLARRLRSAEKIFLDRSKCPHCSGLIRWYDNIPVLSFLILKAKCRDCKKEISASYPLIEILTGTVFALVAWKFFAVGNPETWVATLYYLVAASALIAILIYDYLYMEVPGVILWSAIFLAVVFNLWADWASVSSISSLGGLGMLGSWGSSFSGNLGALAAFIFFFALSAFSRETWMGMGDAYLAILLGLFLGAQAVILAIFASFTLGAVYGIILIAKKKKNLKSAVPFAPFLVLGTFIALFFYEEIAGWYWGLL
jgi:leader peptidase (prepilin peptidase)/N-methyltransferase